MAALLEGHWRPTSYAYPSGEMYLLRVAYTIAYAAGNAVGAWAELYATHLAQPFPFLLVARGWSVLTGTATVLAIALLAQRAFGAPHGLLAGLLLACSFGHVRLRPGAEQLALFEPIDASAFPLRGFDAVEAPGPTITIWRLR